MDRLHLGPLNPKNGEGKVKSVKCCVMHLELALLPHHCIYMPVAQVLWELGVAFILEPDWHRAHGPLALSH